VIYTVDGTVHVSGHASREEIKTLINIVKPHYVLPFHGEYRHKVEFTRLAVDMGIPENRVINIENGERWEFCRQKARPNGRVTAGEVMVDGLGIGDVGNIVLHDRQVLSAEGVVVVVLAVGQKTGTLLAGPDIVSRGFVYMRENMELMDEAKALIARELNKLSPSHFNNWLFLKEIITKTLSAFIYKNIGRRPVILPIITLCRED